MKTENYLIKYCCPKCKKEWVLVHDSAIDSDCVKCGARHIAAIDYFLVKDVEEFLNRKLD